jgi:predicted metal-dependent HD superfamily phosphohydrolase
MSSLAAWSAVWNRLGAMLPDEALYGQLLACYAQPHRHYHTRQHLDECFVHLEQVRQWAEQPHEIEIALWFHDAIYDTKSHHNEAQSANWARTAVLSQGIAPDVAQRIHALVMATQHHAKPVGHDTAMLIDIDLGILGTAPNRFAEYETQVREEYAWVPACVYKRERCKVLQGFLNRPSIYTTPYFQATYEAQAQENLRLSLSHFQT